MLIAAGGQAVASFVLMLGALAGDPPLVLVYAAAGLAGGLSGFSLSARSATTPNTVPASQLSQAIALNQVMWQTCQIVGPAVGGVIVGGLGLSWAYGLDIAQLRRRHRVHAADVPAAAATGHRFPARRGGLRMAGRPRGLPLPQGPAGAPDRVHRRPDRHDLRHAPGVVPGARGRAVPWRRRGGRRACSPRSRSARSLGALTTGWVGRVRRQGLAVLVAVAVWGVGIAGFGLVGDLLWAGVDLPRGRGRGRRHLGDLPGHDPPAVDARQPARPAHRR